MSTKLVKVYVIAGLKSVGKSSVIRYTSGTTVENVVNLQTTNNGNLNTFCKIMSLQEADIAPADVQIHINKKTARKFAYSAVMVAVRTDTTRNMPLADAYMNEFVNTFGWQIEGVAELGGGNVLQAYCQLHKYKYQSFNIVPKNAVNQLCENVKTFLI
jgi:GTP1/Obg family GTP-binding protein